MTVQALRDLARKAIGRGHSKLKTKKELIEALQAAERKVSDAAEKAASKMKEATGRAARATGKGVGAVRGKGKEVPAAEKLSEEPRAPAREKVPEQPEQPEKAEKRKGRRVTPGRTGAGQVARAVLEEAGAAKEGARRARAVSGEPEPDPEGYMVARVAGEDAVRGAPHPMTESAMEAGRGARETSRRIGVEAQPGPNAYDEQLGELPYSYADDVLMALPRDPKTLFLYWDHAQDTLGHAWRGVEGGRAQLWVFTSESDGRWKHVRTVDFALESRSYYIHDLEPGRVYRAEIHLLDLHGKHRLLPRPSNEMMLPPVGPSPIIDDRFMGILWSEPLQRLLREAHPGGPFPEDVRVQLARLSDWSLFAARPGGSSAGGMGGRSPSPTSSPSAPWSASSPGHRSDGEDR
jgi:hypothetical protein